MTKPRCTSCTDRYDQLVHNRVDLAGPWTGWRMRGRVLVSPQGERISSERLAGILFVESMRLRRDAAEARRAREKPVCRVMELQARA